MVLRVPLHLVARGRNVDDPHTTPTIMRGTID